MAGAHLDSVLAGPGINDNGSGSAAILEVAQQIAKVDKTQNTLRFAWWGAEESGLVGSDELRQRPQSQAEQDKIALYLNFDMVGSPNYVFMTQDADQSSFVAPVVVPPGSTAIEDLLESFYTWKGEPYDDAAFDGRKRTTSGSSRSASRPVASSPVRRSERPPSSGRSGAARWAPSSTRATTRPATHSRTTTTTRSTSTPTLIAFAMLTYAQSTESVNDVKGAKVPGNFRIPAPAGSEGTFVP